MVFIAQNRIFCSWLLVATIARSIIAATTDFKIRPIVKVTLPHPPSIVNYLCSPRARSFSPVGTLCGCVDDIHVHQILTDADEPTRAKWQ